MMSTDAERAVQDAMNLLETFREQCTDLAGWGHLFRAQRYLLDPGGYEIEVLRLYGEYRGFTASELNWFQL